MRKVNNKIIYINEYTLIKNFINVIITIKIIIIIIIIKVYFVLNFKTNISILLILLFFKNYI